MTWPEMPEDQGSDRYGYVELIGAPPHVQPDEQWVDVLLNTCPDCNVNLFMHWDPDQRPPWRVEFAHDSTCPWLKSHEETQ